MSNKKTTLIEGDFYVTSSSDPLVYGDGSLEIAGSLTVNGSIIGSISATHSSLSGLANDDHTQYALLSGRSGGQVLTGGTVASNVLTLRSTSNATKGQVFIDETTTSISTSTGALRVAGGVGIGGTLFTGTSANIASTSGITTIGSSTALTVSAAGVLTINNTTVSTSTTTGSMIVAGGVGISGALYAASATFSTLSAPHSGFTGLNADDHIQYALLVGRVGGQILTGGTSASNNLTIRSTSNATKGSIIIDETTASTSSGTGSVVIAGGIGISNTTDAVSSTNGGSVTTAGGMAVAKKLFVGTDTRLASTSGITTIGSATALTISATGVLTINNTTASTNTTSGSLIVGGGVGIAGTLFASSGNFTTLTAPHSGLSGLVNDDHAQYALLTGRTGGQLLTGGTASGNNLTIRSTSNATKGSIIIDETTTSTSNSTGALRILGGIGISNTTDAVSASNGGTFTTAGGMGITKKLFVGSDTSLSTTSGITTIGSSTALTVSASGVLTVTNTTVSTSTTTGSLIVGGGVGIAGALYAASATFATLSAPHSGFTGLNADDHTQYSLLAGRTGGQILTGGTAASNNLTIRSTSNATKGSIIIDETTASTSSGTGSVVIAGGVGISNTTDATSVISGGSFTTAGGMATAKQLFVGTRLSINGTQPILDGGERSRLFMTGPAANSGTGPHMMATVDGSIYPIFHLLNYDRDIVSLNFDMYYSGASYKLSNTGTTGFQITKISNSLQFNYSIAGTTGNPATLAIALLISNSGILSIGSTASSTSNSTGALLLLGGIGINNTTEATSTTNGGTITTAGGISIAKRLYTGGNIYLDGEDRAFTVDISATRRLGIVKKSGGGPFFATASNASFDFRVANSTTIDNVSATTYTSLATLSNVGLLNLTSTTDATSSTAGGTFSTAGGAAISKKLFVGNDVSLATVSGTTTIGSSTPVTVSASGAVTINNTNVSTSITTGALIVNGGVGISGTLYAASANFATFSAPHSGFTGLNADDHTQYALLAGRTGGQILTGGTAASNNLTIRSTSNATKGSIIIDETTATTSSSTGALLLSGGIGISNTNDAVSSTNGGSFTTAGGISVAKKAFIGTDLAVGGTTLLSNYFQTINITAPSNPPASNIRFYTDSADSLLKSKNSTGIVTTYQPTTTKGDLESHNGTTQVRVPVGLDNTYLIADSTQAAGLRWGNLVNVYYIYEQRNQGTNGGSAVANSWLQRTLNTVDAYPTGTTKVTLSGSDMIFAPGVYKIVCSAPFSINNGNVATRLFNVTANAVALTSLTHRTTNSDAQLSYVFIYGILTFTVTSTLRLQYFSSLSRATYGLGRASGLQVEKFSHLEIQLIN